MTGIAGESADQKVNGRKRRLVMDTLDLILALVAQPADVRDRVGTRLVLIELQALECGFPDTL